MKSMQSPCYEDEDRANASSFERSLVRAAEDLEDWGIVARVTEEDQGVVTLNDPRYRHLNVARARVKVVSEDDCGYADQHVCQVYKKKTTHTA
jgi:hypothetical protein